jgi:hypothetical protein
VSGELLELILIRGTTFEEDIFCEIENLHPTPTPQSEIPLNLSKA